MLDMSRLQQVAKSNAPTLPHDLRDIYYARDRPAPLPILESREGVINQLREIDDSLANVVRMEDECLST
jgi:hypothetical protein